MKKLCGEDFLMLPGRIDCPAKGENEMRWKIFDVYKGVACIAIVLVHYSFTGFLAEAGNGLNAFCRFAVPVFFAISGFFLTSRGNISDESLARKIRHVVSIIAVSALFYLVFCLAWHNVLYRGSFDFAAYRQERLAAGNIVKFFLTNDPFVYSHLWYLFALLYCYLTALLCFRNGKTVRLFYALAPVLACGMIAMQEFSGVLHIRNSVAIPASESSISVFNLYLFRALPFFLFGMICREYREKIGQIPGRASVWILVAVLGSLLAVAERYLVAKNCQFFVGSYISLAALFIAALKKPDMDNRVLGYIGREMSLYVYILHIAVGKTYDIVASRWSLWKNTAFICTRPFVVLAGSLLAAFVINAAWKTLRERRLQ